MIIINTPENISPDILSAIKSILYDAGFDYEYSNVGGGCQVLSVSSEQKDPVQALNPALQLGAETTVAPIPTVTVELPAFESIPDEVIPEATVEEQYDVIIRELSGKTPIPLALDKSLNDSVFNVVSKVVRDGDYVEFDFDGVHFRYPADKDSSPQSSAIRVLLQISVDINDKVTMPVVVVVNQSVQTNIVLSQKDSEKFEAAKN